MGVCNRERERGRESMCVEKRERESKEVVVPSHIYWKTLDFMSYKPVKKI